MTNTGENNQVAMLKDTAHRHKTNKSHIRIVYTSVQFIFCVTLFDGAFC